MKALKLESAKDLEKMLDEYSELEKEMAEKDRAHKEQQETSFASHKAQEVAMGERLMDLLKKSEELELVKHNLEKENQALTHELNSTKEKLPIIETTLMAHAELQR
eukprot:1077626-Pyramimonas_sp.AAC.1